MTIIIAIVLVLAITMMLIASLGIIRLPTSLARQHAATKAATLSISLFVISLMLYVFANEWGVGWIVRLTALLFILLITLPVASHALGKSAFVEQSREYDGNDK